MTAADLARNAGFASRSFLSEYFSGKKNLSTESLRSLKAALKLPKEYKQYFSLLVALDQPDLKLKTGDVTAELERYKRQILQKGSLSEADHISLGEVISKRHCFLVFSALGTENLGASISEIAAKLKMKEHQIKDALSALKNAGLVNIEGSRYFPKTSAFDFLNFSKPELNLLVKDVTSEIKHESEELVTDPNSLILYSAMTLESAQIPKFRERLREAIYEVMDDFQKDDGDCVYQVFTCTKS